MIKFKLNGKFHELQVEATQPLLWVLRDVLDLKGTKYGCGVGVCGICMVHIDGEATRSCVTPISFVNNKDVTTIEGFSLEHPVVNAWLAEQVPQCGYCQPGQVMAAVALLQCNPEPNDTAIDAALSGVLCRCGTYPRIRRAIHRAAEMIRGGYPSTSPSASVGETVQVITTLPDSESPDVLAPNPWVRVHRNGKVTVIIDRSEMGQGVITGLAMLVAEELEIELDQVRAAFAPAAPAYINPIIGEQLTGGSTSIRGSWKQLRHAAAQTREILLKAAAQIWGVPPHECRAERGQVLHLPSAQRLGYGELVYAARSVAPPANIALKDPCDFKLIGQSTPRLDAPAMVLGQTIYGMDVSLPRMYVASVERSPTLAGRLQGFDASKAYQIPGVVKVVEISSGVAVIADSTHAALQGRAALATNWTFGPLAELSTAVIQQGFKQAAARQGAVHREQGDVLRVLNEAPQVLEAEYETPYLAHGCLEPMNCTAQVGKDRCEVWVGTQAQTADQRAAAKIARLPIEHVLVHTQFLGGGFGRRGDSDFVREAVQIATTVENPVQLVWTRQDDIQYDHYRPANYTVMKAVLDTQGKPLAWFQRVVGPSLALDGVNIAYAMPNFRIEFVKQDPQVPTGAWRSVGASQNAFSIECFIDELAHSAGTDPLEYRLALLAQAPRFARVLRTAAEKAGWQRNAMGDRHQGVAFYHSFKSAVAQIAEVSVSATGEIVVHRVVCAIDCGIAVNPDQVAAQIEGAIVFGLSAALKGEITIENARIQQSTFEDYPILTMAQTPQIEVHIVSSKEPPGGVGEPGVPPIAPAVANAAFAATGKRLRSLPLRLV